MRQVGIGTIDNVITQNRSLLCPVVTVVAILIVAIVTPNKSLCIRSPTSGIALMGVC